MNTKGINTEVSYRTRGEKAILRRRRQLRKRVRLLAVLFFLGAMIFTAIPYAANIIAGTGSRGGIMEIFMTDRLEEEGIPESLQELAKKNPETAEFVRDYKKKAGVYADIDLSGEVEKGKIPLFLQWDERWGYKKYGDDYFALTGCGPTCLSMVYCGLTGDTGWTPYRISQKAEKEGYYVEGSGSSWNMMTGLAKELGLGAEEGVFDAAHIQKYLQNGEPVIAIMGAGDFTTTGHFIVLTGINKDGTIKVNDPNSRRNSKKGWELDTLMRQMRNLWVYHQE